MFARIINPETGEPALTGQVAEVISWSPEGRYPPEWIWVECPDNTRQFAGYDGDVFDNPPLPEPPPYEPPPPILPPLTRRQLRLGLLSIGVTAEDVETHIAAITDPVDRAAALIEWEGATHYKRDHPLVADVAAEMQLPPEQVDALWVWAAGA